MIAFFCRLVPLHSLNHQPACPSISPACSSKHMIRIKIICWSIVVYFAFSVLPLLYCKVTNVSGCSRLCSGRSGVLGTRYVVRRPVQEEMMTMTVCPEAQSGIQLSEKRRWEGGSGVQCGVLGRRRKPLLIVQLMMTTTETDPQCTADDCLYYICWAQRSRRGKQQKPNTALWSRSSLKNWFSVNFLSSTLPRSYPRLCPSTCTSCLGVRVVLQFV